MIFYKNSFLASVVSLFGCASAIAGISSFGVEPGGAIIAIIGGVILVIWGKTISDDKAFKVWWKKVVDANLLPQIVASKQVALEIYNKNPQERTLKKIAELNPVAADQIRASIAANKANNKK